ncbi:septation ring formation regulator EzrA, partial [Salmonella enterica]
DKFVAEEYILPDNVNIKERMDDLHDHLVESSSLLEQFELDRVEAELGLIQEKVEELYAIFEREYSARRNVEKRSSVLK